MLLSLHVKNFAIIDEAEVEFCENLNILTGETGAGKSIIIGSVNAALGAKVSKDIVRKNADYALIELIFKSSDSYIFEKLKSYELPVEGDEILVSRKLMANGRSVAKINGETVTIAILKEIAELLLDIHGQHEHQSLLHQHKHLEIVDAYAGIQAEELKKKTAVLYKEFKQLSDELKSAEMDDELRLREISFLQYELDKIQEASLKIGEDEELQIRYRRLSNTSEIAEGIGAIYQWMAEKQDSVADNVGRAVKQVTKLIEYDSSLQEIYQQLADLESCISDLNHDLAEYMDSMDINEEEYKEVEQRLDLINSFKLKYGNSIDAIIEYAIQCTEKLEKYRNHDIYISKLKNQIESCEKEMESMSGQLSALRQEKAEELAKKISAALVDLNFAQTKFSIFFKKQDGYSANGYDEVEFMFSVNPGEPLQPLKKVASGGELSRIMLAIKSVLAEQDAIDTLIFDEIDTGISGRTAQKVSEKLVTIAQTHQVICITHLPQIAAMSDHHYLIEKATDESKTWTQIRTLEAEASILEIARLLGGAEITEHVVFSAKEMKMLAAKKKKELISSFIF